ncbi:putative serine protease PepD [Microbacterium sp. W4I4]|uniref:S1C family serine protease n=1 Tax=Microbacterium sp. W4I4 TaxID=3042295 RepID=UPI00277D324D|nr:trypsin-like peptidase domain-containing protein [Microbacterium sp. W4I4]MDQ0613338.1 putative serine protease PepD [Microbacterium sp. W4I4]
MNDDNTHGETPTTPEVPSAGSTPTTPQAPVPGAAAAPAQGTQSAPGSYGAPQQTWQPPYGAPAQPQQSQPQQAQPGPAQGAPQQPAGYGAPAYAHNAPHVTGTAFGAAAQQPQTAQQSQTLPLDPALLTAPAGAENTNSPRKGSGTTTKVAGLLLAAALVGGVAGFGGSALGGVVFDQPTSQSADGPQTVTVNNPGSVNETTAIASKVLPSVVTIEVAGSQASGSGSGIVLNKEGYVLTNTHVATLGGAVADPTIRVTTSDGHIYSATVVGTDPIYDLAVIKLKDATNLTPMTFADSSKLNVGDTAVAVGAPLGLSNSVTTGIVSALNRSIQVASSALPDNSTQQDQPDEQGNGEGGPFQFDIPGMGAQQAKQSISIAVIQTDAAINPGNSGGALVDSKGGLIGVNVAIATAGQSSSSSGEPGSIGVGFAIPSDIAQRVAKEIMQDGSATHGLLGATVRDASSLQDATVAGAVIETPTPGGGAAKAGLQQGDIVTEFNGVPIASANDLTAQVRAAAAGSTAKVVYVRSGKTYTAEATLGTLKL